MRKICRDTQCRRAGKRLALEEFPRNQNMSDGRFSYCRECAGRRTKEYRARLKVKKEAQRKEQIEVVKKQKEQEPPPLCKVYDAICAGARTRQAIYKATELDYDEIGEALCELWEAKAVLIRDREILLAEEVVKRDGQRILKAA